VEDKTLKTRQKGINILRKSQYAAVWLSRKRYRDRGSRGRKVIVIAQRSRNSAVRKDQKSRWGTRILQEIPRCQCIRVIRCPVQAIEPRAVRQFSVSKEITEKAIWK
jgi:hypothetical protein